MGSRLMTEKTKKQPQLETWPAPLLGVKGYLSWDHGRQPMQPLHQDCRVGALILINDKPPLLGANTSPSRVDSAAIGKAVGQTFFLPTAVHECP